MADDFGDKTEAPTPQRRIKAREEGNIARSNDLTAAVMLLAFMMLLDFSGMGLMQALRSVMAALLGNESLGDLTTAGLSVMVSSSVILVGKAMLPLLGGIVVVAIAINLVQVGFYANAARLQPKLSSLNPLKGFQKVFGKKEGLMSGLMNAAKLSIVSFVAYSAIRDRMGMIVTVQQYDFLQIFAIGADVIYRLAIRLGMVLLVLAIIDYAWRKWKHEQEMKMSKQEVKDEMKRMDGDPQTKARRREIARQTAMKRIQTDVPTADVIVTNPTHFAIALKYDGDAMHAPRVVAKGADFMAMRIREIAVANGIPILERPPLARALYKLVDVGQEIPEQFYAAVAEILAYVFELTGKTKRRMAG